MGSFFISFNMISRKKLLLLLFVIKGSVSQENCCLKKTVNGINYVLAEYTGLTPDPSCLNSCIYQEENNPSSYVCFKDGAYNAECLVETSGYGGNFDDYYYDYYDYYNDYNYDDYYREFYECEGDLCIYPQIYGTANKESQIADTKLVEVTTSYHNIKTSSAIDECAASLENKDFAPAALNCHYSAFFNESNGYNFGSYF